MFFCSLFVDCFVGRLVGWLVVKVPEGAWPWMPAPVRWSEGATLVATQAPHCSQVRAPHFHTGCYSGRQLPTTGCCCTCDHTLMSTLYTLLVIAGLQWCTPMHCPTLSPHCCTMIHTTVSTQTLTPTPIWAAHAHPLLADPEYWPPIQTKKQFRFFLELSCYQAIWLVEFDTF